MSRSHSEDEERRTAYSHFSWFHWLHTADPDCELAKQALNRVWKANPSFTPTQHPDLTHNLEVGSALLRRAWSVDELLARPATEWITDLSSFLEEDSLVPECYDLLRAVEGAATRNFEWGLDLADALAESEDWGSDLWPYQISAWSRELDEAKHREVLRRLARTELYSKQAQAVADGLHALVKGGGVSYASELLAEANQLAITLWDRLDRFELSFDSDDWFRRAINHPAGIVAQFWIESLSLWGRQQDPRPETLGEEYRTAFSTIMSDDTIAGRLGTAVLGRHLGFFLAIDENWGKDHLIPSFENANGEDYCAIWHGFLYGGFLDPQVAKALEDAFLKAVSSMASLFPTEGKLREKFIAFYSLMVAYFVEDPIDSWIPRLLTNAEENERRQFAWKLGRILDEMNDAQQQEWWGRWLKLYWKNRLHGIPEPLDDVEITGMIDWLPYFRSVYPEAVEIAVRMEHASLENSPIIHQINQSDLWQKHPWETAKLLIHLGRAESPSWAWENGKELIEKLLQTDLPESLKTDLRELVIELSLE